MVEVAPGEAGGKVWSQGQSRGKNQARGRGRIIPEENCAPPPGTYVAKSGRVWSTEVPAPRRRAPQNIIRERAGPKGNFRKDTIYDMFSLFITQAIKDKIIQHTNEEGGLVYERWNEEWEEENQKEFKEIDLIELNAFIVVLILRGLFAGCNESVMNLWAKSQYSRPIFTGSMARSRFSELLKLIRFDDRGTRDARRFHDSFAPVREVFDVFNSHLRKYLKSSECLTIDEMLVKFRGNARFRYI